MKLAEALLERKALLDKIKDTWERWRNNLTKLEDETTNEDDPHKIIEEAYAAEDRLTGLIMQINRTNNRTTLPNGQTLMEAIARRDVLKGRLTHLDTTPWNRTGLFRGVLRRSKDDVKVVQLMTAQEIRHEYDRWAKELRELDLAIQAAGWVTELL